MSPWMNESQDLFRTARRATSPSAEDRDRVRARLAAHLGAATMAGAAVTVAAGTANAGVKATAVPAALKILAVFVGAAALASAVALRVQVRGAPPREPAESSAPSPAEPSARSAPSPSPAPADPPRPATPAAPVASPVVVARPTAPTPKVADPAAEAELARAMDRALRDGDPAGALRLAAEHERRFPHGVLSEEREGVRAMARCATGDHAAGMGFLRAHPKSPLRARITKACEP